MAAINSPPVVSNAKSAAYLGESNPFLGAGVGGFGEVYVDDKFGIELSYTSLFQNQVPRASQTPDGVKNQNLSYLAYLIKFKPSGDTEFGLGGGQFGWESPLLSHFL